MMWTAILCVQAGGFLQNCITAIWPSFANFPNHLSPSAAIDCTYLAISPDLTLTCFTAAGLLCFFLYWIVQTLLSIMPIRKLRLLFLAKAIIVPPTFVALFLWAVMYLSTSSQPFYANLLKKNSWRWRTGNRQDETNAHGTRLLLPYRSQRNHWTLLQHGRQHACTSPSIHPFLFRPSNTLRILGASPAISLAVETNTSLSQSSAR